MKEMKEEKMKCVCVVALVLLHISTATSQSVMTPPGPNLIRQLCNHTTFPKLCFSSLSSNPSSLTSNLQGLAAISVGIVSKKANETLRYLIDELKKVRDRGNYQMYGTCIEEYGAAVDRFLPAASAHLRARRYAAAITALVNVSTKPQNCEDQFGGKSPLSERDLAVHDLAVTSADVIKVLATSN